MAAIRRVKASRPYPSITDLSVLLLLSLLPHSSFADVDRIFLSGVADTKQYFHVPRATDNGSRVNVESSQHIRHHLTCFHRGGRGGGDYASGDIPQEREKCCFELYQNGLIEGDERPNCLDHIAKVPDISISAGKKKRSSSLGNVAPAFYLAKDEDITDSNEEASLRHHHHRQPYNQNRQLKVYEDKERETFRDGFKGVGAFSPFHLTGFVSDGETNKAASNQNESVFPFRGRVEGILSREGGMHRSFQQRVHLSLNRWSDVTSDKKYQMTINATILLPITESIFIDADDPFIFEYDGASPEGISCKVSVGNENLIQSKTSVCHMKFLHPETIDIEHPSFASRQYVVAYQVNARLDLSFGPNSRGTRRELDVVIDYGTTLHIRYPPPISNNAKEAFHGLVPLVIQQPALYSSSIWFGDEAETNAKYYNLRTEVIDENSSHPEPIVIHVPAGLDNDYWWITIVTLSSAMIGGLVLMKSLDSVSEWG
mmetsp:Transcript_11569/g.24668  ORF Transcript_11569/g.24668 Transcript_11569/m.24668 type:complete len:485 (+) Transcript_11569:169-1623(+)|eukprot:CAMPEP_0183734340 /NCGR_PEP_ID=MMETSP0737-20130205/43567_1 /TAXON_ID=385413 /ORGANISM="Thalassiosira miniscula, Strain CCMP1093" /LENGTH=484 /DNA_ID=CAMNT_0025967805 /DNA_START=84 /DNA_END=1541 /DNA_ORIENTATION=-